MSDFEHGRARGLSEAAAILQDYAHLMPRPDLVRVQQAVLRARDVAACTVCSSTGGLSDDEGRSVDHHPLAETGLPEKE